MAIVTTKKNYCFACGQTGDQWIAANIINDELASEWKLNTKLREIFDRRESSFCPRCGNSSRTRFLAEATVKTIPLGADCLVDWVQKANKKHLRVAEINGCGQLHEILIGLNHLSYSEFVPERDIKTRVKNFLKDIRREDLHSLSYKDGSFDLVINSDVLEHVPDYKLAIAESTRVLKTGGVFLFTIPLIWRRKTLSRTKMKPSYHGSGESDNLVITEFGGDVVSASKLEVFLADRDGENYVLGKRRLR